MMEYEVIAAEQLKVLKEQFNEPQSLKRLVHIFSDNSMRLLTEMKVFLMDENIAAIRAHAHQLKSSAKII